MIRKLVDLLSKKVFIPKSELEEVKPPQKKEIFQQPIVPSPGIPAPVITSSDPWFSEPVKTEKVIAYEKHVAAEIEKQKIIEAAQPKKKESKNIHQKMYEMATKNWTTVAETQGGSENFQEGPGGWNSGTGHHQFRG